MEEATLSSSVTAVYPERQFDFMGRLFAVPLVASLLIRASRLYEKAKNHSVFISLPMTAVETTVRKTVLVCRALLMPLLSRQLLYVEALASRVFHQVQERLTEAFFQPDEIVAYVILMVAQLMLCTITKMAVLCRWVMTATDLLNRLMENVAAIVLLLKTGVHSAVDAADHHFDTLMVPYEIRHDPCSKNGGAVLPLSSNIRTVLHKLKTLTKLVFWDETKRLLDGHRWAWTVALNLLHYQNSSETLLQEPEGDMNQSLTALVSAASAQEFELQGVDDYAIIDEREINEALNAKN
ncbi:uncharacterized protein LOC119169450 [Rhipicephalus microplus]|uniref:uncharacterized protein LOC119169450 n=1 Tax=Rhipicephalus microplus TaxID=6941 RepID=UPI003F6AF425